MAEINAQKLAEFFEFIVRKNNEHPDVDIDLTRLNNAISSFDTYKSNRTQVLFRFFQFGYEAGSMDLGRHSDYLHDNL